MRIATLIVVWVGSIVLLASVFPFSAAAEQDKASDDPRRRADAFLIAVDDAIERLKSAGRNDDARPLADETARLRGWLDGPLERPHSATPELYALAVQTGGPFPPGYMAEENSLAEGYAEVRVGVVGRPVVLALSSQRGVHWRVTAEDKVQIFAVILVGAMGEVSGLPGGTLILDSGLDTVGRAFTDANFTYRDTGDDFEHFETRLHDLTGLALQSMTGVARYEGRPLIVGPESAAWRAQIVIREVERVLAAERAPLAADLAKLRFTAAYFRQTGGHEYSRDISTSVGEFTIKGPILSTLRYRPESFRHFARDGREYTLAWAFESYAKGRPTARIASDPQVPRPGDLAAVALDTCRRRLIAPVRGPETGLFAYDNDKAQWSRLADPGHPLLAIAYAADHDAIFAVAAAPRDWIGNSNRRLLKPVPRKLLKLAPDGRVLASIEPSHPLEVGPVDAGAVQLVYADGKLILLGRPTPIDGGRFTNPIQVLDPANGRVLYTGESRPQTDDGRDAKLPAPVDPFYRDRGRLAQWIRERAATEKTLAELRRAGRTDQAQKFERELANIHRDLATTESAPSSDEPELYRVGCGRSTVLEVTDTSRPIVLAIQAEGGVIRLSVLEDVRLVRVFANHNVLDVPPGVPVARWPQSGEQGIRELTRATTTTHVSARRPRITLGPESGDWRLDRALTKLTRLNLENQPPAPAPKPVDLAAVRFRAMYRFMAAGEPQAVGSASAEFSPRGPFGQTLAWRNPALRNVWEVRPSGELLASSAEGVFRSDSDGEPLIPIAPDITALKSQKDWAAAFDIRRQRLLLTFYGSDRHLYAYHINNRLWRILRTPGIGAMAMCHVAANDSLYVLLRRESAQSRDRIARYTAYGVRLGEFRIRANPQRNSATSRLELDEGVQLADAGEYLALVTTGRVDRRTNRVSLPMLHLIERDSGEVLYSGRLRPHARFEPLSDREISAAFETLAAGTDTEADSRIWKLAGGGDKTIAFLAAHLGKPKDFDREKVRRLFVQLDDEKFAVREEAQRELAGFGPEIEATLSETAKTSSTEVRARVRRLIERFHKGPPRDPETLRQYRGLDVLERIATPAAVDLLRRVTLGTAYPQVARRAKQVLDSLARDEALLEASPPEPR